MSAADLRKLDEEIALLRGWTEQPSECGEPGCRCGTALQRTPGTPSANDLGCSRAHGPGIFPPYSSSWDLAGPLLVEMDGSVGPLMGAWSAHPDGARQFPDGTFEGAGVGETAQEAIARAWLRWRKARS